MARHVLVCAVALWVLATAVRAEDAFYRVSLKDLKLTEGKLPQLPEEGLSFRYSGQRRQAMPPGAQLDGPGEAYVWPTPAGRGFVNIEPLDHPGPLLLLRVPKDKEVSGRLYLPKSDFSSMELVKFRIDPAGANANAERGFWKAKLAHYQGLLDRNIAGAAWFRHQVRDARQHLGQQADEGPDRMDRWQRRDDVEETYALFTGGRAVSENLQLDRVLPATRQAQPATVSVDEIPGINIAEIDWKPLVKDLKPEKDALAEQIPLDQHAIFFPTFEAAMALADEADAHGTPVLALAETRLEDAGVKGRYQKQLCLSLTGLGRMLGSSVINSVAVTGSDVYWRVGSDVAVLFEPKNGEALKALLKTQIAAVGQLQSGAKAVAGEVGGVAYSGIVSPDRAVSSYLAEVGKAVVVTNSLKQLERLVAVAKGDAPALASSPEYTFFRSRYRKGEEETAFILLTDATIRRWCSARWRIADSRRTRAAAVLSELQAQSMDKLAAGAVEPGPLHTDRPIGFAGELRLTPAGVTSSAYGLLDLMTPVVEMDMAKVTEEEKVAYIRWRNNYQMNWRWAFDPIAIRFTIKDKGLAADASVMPLIWATEYRRFIDVAKGAAIPPGTSDPHNALLHWVLAINPDSPTLQWGKAMLGQWTRDAKMDPLAWMGGAMSIYADDDPFWEELAKAEKADRFMEKSVHRLPVAVRFEVSSAMKLTAFLAGVHAFIDQTAPGMTRWEPQTYREKAYVRISPTEEARQEMRGVGDMAVFYQASGDGLVLTLSEDLMKRSIDRQIARRQAAAAATNPATGPAPKLPATRPWLGQSLCLHADGKIVQMLKRADLSQAQDEMQARAWGNIVILNEWKHRYPDEDPLKLHQRIWGTTLIDPAGGSYVWNDKDQTMESTHYGSPVTPKAGPVIPGVLEKIASGNFGVTFEDQGLRARAELEKK